MTANYDIAPSFWRVYQTQQSFVGSLSNRNRIASNVRCSISQILRKSEKTRDLLRQAALSAIDEFGESSHFLWVHHRRWTKRVATQIGCCPMKHVPKTKRELKIKRFTCYLRQIFCCIVWSSFIYMVPITDPQVTLSYYVVSTLNFRQYH